MDKQGQLAACKAIERINQQRIEPLRSSFPAIAYKAMGTFIRARIAYSYQIGCYSLGIHEFKSLRQHYLPL